jgi:hypothetical protein
LPFQPSPALPSEAGLPSAALKPWCCGCFKPNRPVVLLSCWRPGGSRASATSCSKELVKVIGADSFYDYCGTTSIRQQRRKFEIVAFRVLHLDRDQQHFLPNVSSIGIEAVVKQDLLC